MQTPSRIIISRTDSIGDVVLSLPMAGIIKERFPEAQIWFLGRTYTKDIIALSEHIDGFINWDDICKLKSKSQRLAAFKTLQADTIIHVFPDPAIAKLAKQSAIPSRIGTSGRLYHYLYCNEILRFTRRRSDLHEAQLNIKLLQPLGLGANIQMNHLPRYYGLTNVKPLQDEYAQLLDPNKMNLILHPKSKGSAREWGLNNFEQLIDILPAEKFKIFISGTEQEGLLSRDVLISGRPHITDLTGRMDLNQFIAFIQQADGLIAASTGPLHIAAALGKWVLGIYPPIKPMHPGRWGPIGQKAQYLVNEKDCSECRKLQHCACMEGITAEEVKRKLEAYV